MCHVSSAKWQQNVPRGKPIKMDHCEFRDISAFLGPSHMSMGREWSTALRRAAGASGILCSPLSLVLLFGVVAGSSSGQNPAAGPAHANSTQYVGSVTCSGCHGEIYRSYVGTAMGRSMEPVVSQH